MTHGPKHRISHYVALLLFTLTFYFTMGVRDACALETRSLQHLFDLTRAANSPLSLPSDVAVAPDGRIYVVDGNNDRVVVYNAEGKYLATIGKQGTDDGEMNAPIGIDVDAKGDVYVADSGNDRLQVFNPAGKFIRQIPVREKHRRIKPIDVAVDNTKGILYVTGNTNHKVMLYTVKGKYRGAWGHRGNNPGEFRYPATITVTRDGLIYVVDVLNSRVQIFQRNGKLLTVAGSWGVLPGQLFRPKGVAVDAKGNIYVSDSYMDLIEVFNSSRQFSHVLGQNNHPHKFITPAGITLDSHQRIYVTEMLSNKVSVYELK
jgi:DNA-binding beta-propeller fold protein YncE